MKRATHDTDVVVEYGEVIGINLGWDFVGQHERGIKELEEDFGIELGKEYGFEDRRNTIVPEDLIIGKKRGDFLFLYDKFRSKKSLNRLFETELMMAPDSSYPFVAAWDDKSFGVRSREYGSILENLYGAFQTKNGVMVTMQDGNPFSRCGLTLLDYRLIPEPTKDAFRELDREHYEK